MDEYSNNSKNSTIATRGGYTQRMDANDYEYRQLGFGQAVRYHRKRLKLSQADLAERIGVGTSTVSWYERQTKPINDPFILFELAGALGTSADDLREGRVRLEPKGRTMHDYIEDIIAVDAPEGVPIEDLRELLDIAAGLSPRSLRALVEFGQFQQSRQARQSSPQAVNGSDTSGDTNGPDGE
jgi:transcriptional regulator with XRE-family HTH domain